MFNLQIQGTSTIMGVEVPNIFGGFGEGQKSMLTRDIANVHSYSGVGKVNDLIDSHRDEFEDEIDIIDLKEEKYKDFVMLLRDNGILTQNSINRSEHIYLLSEQGYMLLAGFMEGEKAKQVRKQLRREYFAMKQIIQENPIERAMKRAIAEGTSQETLTVLTEEISKKVIEEVTPTLIAEGVNKGIKQGYGQGYTQAELEGKAKLKKELNGQDRGYTYSQLCTAINEQYHGKVKIIASFITDYLLEEGYFDKKVFPAQANGKIKYKNGQMIKENKATKQPTYKFIAEVVNTGCATTKEDFRGKVEVKLLDRFEDWFFDNHFTKFIDYIEKTHK